MLQRKVEYLLSILIMGLAVFLFFEVWVSVGVIEGIYQKLMEGAVFTEGTPLAGTKGYLLFCLCSGAWCLLVLGFWWSRKRNLLYLTEISFALSPVWFVTYVYVKGSANYVFDSVWSFLVHQVLTSGEVLWVVLSIGVAVVGVRQCRKMREVMS